MIGSITSLNKTHSLLYQSGEKEEAAQQQALNELGLVRGYAESGLLGGDISDWEKFKSVFKSAFGGGNIPLSAQEAIDLLDKYFSSK